MNLITKLVKLLNKTQIKQLGLLQLLVIITAIFESISVVAIAPLMSAITDPKGLSQNSIYQIFNGILDLNNANDFILYYSLFFLTIMFISNMLSIITIWLLSVFAAQLGGNLSNRLYNLYLNMNYSKFLTLGSAYITKQISSEVSRLTDNVLQPIVQINARIISGFLICILLFLYNPYAAILSVATFSVAYFIIYFIVKQKLRTNGKNLSEINQSRFRFISEGFGAFREIKSFGASKVFSERFSKSSNEFSKAYSTLNTIYNAPRYIIEFFVFTTLVFLIYRYNSINNNLELLSVISVFGLAALKLLPIFQQIYSCFAQIRGHKNALNLIFKDIMDVSYISDILDERALDIQNNISKLNANQSIILKLENISFYYTEDKAILKNININIKSGTKTAIVGKSGAGKTTLSDLITGLLLPKDGKYIFNGDEINVTNLIKLRNDISIVPQSPFIIQGSFANNVVFTFDEIKDKEKIKLVLNQVGLLSFVNTFENGIDTIIGDGNIQLSGGQKQRLAIARALYRESQIIFFDEPTSSLDPESENEIVKLINSLIPQKTIITISHKLSTIINYDNIIIIDDGQVMEEGNYHDLLLNSVLFKKIMTTEENQ